MHFVGFIFINFLICTSLTDGFIKKILRTDWTMALTSCPATYQSLTLKDYNVTVPSTLHLNLEKHK